MAPTKASSSSTSAPSTAYSLAILTEYTHTLDALPPELSRTMAELRELDAVLSSSLSSLTTKIQNLTEMIEQRVGSPAQRLWLLTELAEEAQRLRLGGEDKIRVAHLAADTLKVHNSNLKTLAESVPDFDNSLLIRRTTFPHVSTRPYMQPVVTEGRRRRAAGAGASANVSAAVDASPAKRKRGAGRDDETPRRERAVARNGGRKKVERAPSPTDSLLSATSHIPQPSTARTAARASAVAHANATASASSAPKRRAAARGGSNQPEIYTNGDSNHLNGVQPPQANGRFNVPPSAAHPSLASYPTGPGISNGHATPYELHARVIGPPVADWTPPPPGMLEGPGMPPRAIARGAAAAFNAGDVAVAEGANGEAGGDGEQDADDGKLYCTCQRVSFGQMIGCDGDDCQWEWFHIGCVGLTDSPQGRWYCDWCRQKKNKRPTARGGRRKATTRASRG
ncbi:unnamed protein product [Mycena citricolor]|uniref:Chromatin modification-related protein n=2 Tax=Mycena citricolor TaxID=2018698 RepID=A0AAD2HTA5_9AGAR|nr:unnamed protein product [Mycena citricolor]CAK5280669.1 unnamed protein product [Mycena citricolor]